MFSVVIPSYRHARYLVPAVLSALTSRWVAEVVLVDDGSEDGSQEMIERLVRSLPGRVRALDGSGRENHGAPRRLDALVEASRSEWVAVLNSDDAFAAGRFDLLRWRCTSGIDFAFGHLLVMDESGQTVGIKRAVLDPEYPFPSDLDVATLVSRCRWLPLLANQNFIATTSNMVFRKSLHARLGGFREHRYVHDWDFALRAAREGRCLYLPHYLSHYRIHATNTIAEDHQAVAAEVREVFAALVAEAPSLLDDADFAAALRGNRYLGPGFAEPAARSGVAWGCG